jgi:hypothetical protein
MMRQANGDLAATPTTRTPTWSPPLRALGPMPTAHADSPARSPVSAQRSRARLAGPPRQLPAVLVLNRTEQSLDVAAHPLALVRARETRSGPLLNLVTAAT